jgi:arylsulfatase A-like enzyme
MRKEMNLVNRSIFVSALCVLSLTGCADVEKPNVLFIAIDDMNDWTTLFDPKHPIKTPNIERLASRGVFFNRAYCVSPACNPSRTAVLTGLRPSTTGVYGNKDSWRSLVPDAVTLPQYFAQNGYTTKGAGKIFHHGEAGRDRLDQPSFQDFFDMLPTRKAERNHNGYTEGPLSRTAFDWGVHDKKIIDLDTVEWVEKVMDAQSENPLFLAAGIFRPHLPFYADQATFNKYPFEETRLPPMQEGDLQDVPAIAHNMAHKEHFIYENVVLPPEDRRGSLKKMVQSYYAAADFADQMVGRLLDKLEATGRTENTIIVLFSDHGYHLGDKESCVKFTLWEKANHVPFIIVAPGLTGGGKVCSKPVTLLDIYPTLVELCGLPKSADVDGVSLLPLLKDPETSWDRPALMTMGRGNHAVRSERWRYIRYSDGSEELYDHGQDPWEWVNLAGDSRYEKVIADHQAWLPEEEVPWQIDESQNWIYRPVEWDDVPRNEESQQN